MVVKSINYAAASLKQQLIADTNEAKLPAIVIRTIYGELYEQAKELEEKSVIEEKADYEKELIRQREKKTISVGKASSAAKQTEEALNQTSESDKHTEDEK